MTTVANDSSGVRQAVVACKRNRSGLRLFLSGGNWMWFKADTDLTVALGVAHQHGHDTFHGFKETVRP